MSTDVDEALAPAQASERLLARLAEPRTAEALERILDRLELVAFGLDAADGFIRRGEQVTDAVAEGMRDLRTLTDSTPGLADAVRKLPELAQTGEQLAAVARTPGFQNLLQSGLIDRLGEPRTIAALKGLIDHMELIGFLVQALDGFVGRGEQVTDAVAQGVADLRKIASGVDTARVQGVYNGLPQVVDAGLTLIDSGMLDPRVVEALGEIGRTGASAFEECKSHPEEVAVPKGLWGLYKAMKDPDVQRATAVFLHVAKRFGQSLPAAPARP